MPKFYKIKQKMHKNRRFSVELCILERYNENNG